MNLGICRAMGIPIREVIAPDDAARAAEWARECSVHVDGLFGTGLTRAVTGAAAALLACVGTGSARVLALDVPSGLDCDTGRPLGPCVRADVTATFAAPKIGFLEPASIAWTGEVVVVGIGAPVDPGPDAPGI